MADCAGRCIRNLNEEYEACDLTHDSLVASLRN